MPCAHHWLLEMAKPRQLKVVAICQKCGAAREFPARMPGEVKLGAQLAEELRHAERIVW